MVNIHLLSSKDQTLLHRWDSFLLLDLFLYLWHLCMSVDCRKLNTMRLPVYLIVALYVKLDLLPCESPYSMSSVSRYYNTVAHKIWRQLNVGNRLHDCTGSEGDLLNQHLAEIWYSSSKWESCSSGESLLRRQWRSRLNINPQFSRFDLQRVRERNGSVC